MHTLSFTIRQRPAIIPYRLSTGSDLVQMQSRKPSMRVLSSSPFWCGITGERPQKKTAPTKCVANDRRGLFCFGPYMGRGVSKGFSSMCFNYKIFLCARCLDYSVRVTKGFRLVINMQTHIVIRDIKGQLRLLTTRSRVQNTRKRANRVLMSCPVYSAREEILRSLIYMPKNMRHLVTSSLITHTALLFVSDRTCPLISIWLSPLLAAHWRPFRYRGEGGSLADECGGGGWPSIIINPFRGPRAHPTAIVLLA